MTEPNYMQQRRDLIPLIEALGCQWKFRRDECGDYRIEGKLGHIYPASMDGVNKGFQIYNNPGSVRRWTETKKALASFCRVIQDGDEEGILFLDHLPTKNQAEAIRSRLGIKKRKEISEEERVRLRQWASDNRPVQRARTPEAGSDG